MKKIVAFLLSCCVLCTAFMISPVSAKENDFKNKIIYENGFNFSDLGEANSDSSTDSYVTVQTYTTAFSCSHTQMNSFEDVINHREELKTYYTNANSAIISSWDLEGYTDVYYSWYGPYILCEYENATNLENDLDILDHENPLNLVSIHIGNNWHFNNSANVGDFTETPYAFSDALNDVGIPSTKTYSGTGINIGILEESLPNDLSNLTNTTYSTLGISSDEHAFWTSSILGSSSGIANDASLYFASTTDYPIVTCFNWLIDNNVHIINISAGSETGTYSDSWLSIYADYLIRETKVTIVASAGNSSLVCSPSTGYNVISVASCNADWKISNFSASTMLEEGFLKPTLTAPGGYLTNIPNVTLSTELPYECSGTSFSAPFVTGVVALLMQEFPILQCRPEQVLTLLANSCTAVNGQTDTFDSNAGFGLVNYTSARDRYVNTYEYSLDTTDTVSNSVFSLDILIPAKSTIVINTAVLCSDVNAPYVTGVKISIEDMSTSSITYGTSISNFSYITFKNDTLTDINYTVSVYINNEKEIDKIEYCALNYKLYIHTHDYTCQYVSAGQLAHKAYCACGAYSSERHDFVNYGDYLYCSTCGYTLPMVR